MEIYTMITLFFALLPTIVIMFLVLINVKHKTEPFKKIASVFGISALSVIPAAILEMIGIVVLTLIFVLSGADMENMQPPVSVFFSLTQYLLIVGVAEELCKFFTFKWIIFHDRQFDNTYDGVIYGAASALGFATLENLLYCFGNGASLQIALMRAVLSIPMHAITGIFMGYYFGISKYYRYNNINHGQKPEIPALVFSIILHGLYDFVCTLPSLYEDSSEISVLSTLMLIGIMIFIYILIGRTIHKAKKETHNIYNRYYYEQLNGNFQDMFGGKTTSQPRMFLGVPLPQRYGNNPNMFNPYNPYANNPYFRPNNGYPNMPPQQNLSYRYGTQQPFNPYMNPQMQSYQNRPAPQYQNGAPYQPGYRYPQQNGGYMQNPQYRPNNQYQQNLNQQNTYQQPAPQPNAQPKAVAVKVKTCSSCGAPISRGSKFCSKCGQPIE
ncbi:MAG: PrsW family glutamic-type intramembrane protease [Oscillospiraceae bacterium]